MNATQTDSLERWSEPLTADERGALLETVALAVRRRGLQTPALFFLEMNRPLGFTACQGLIALAPFIAPLLGLDRVQKLGRLLADPHAVDELVTRLEKTTPPPNPLPRRERGSKTPEVSLSDSPSPSGGGGWGEGSDPQGGEAN